MVFLIWFDTRLWFSALNFGRLTTTPVTSCLTQTGTFKSLQRQFLDRTEQNKQEQTWQVCQTLFEGHVAGHLNRQLSCRNNWPCWMNQKLLVFRLVPWFGTVVFCDKFQYLILWTCSFIQSLLQDPVVYKSKRNSTSSFGSLQMSTLCRCLHSCVSTVFFSCHQYVFLSCKIDISAGVTFVTVFLSFMHGCRFIVRSAGFVFR